MDALKTGPDVIRDVMSAEWPGMTTKEALMNTSTAHLNSLLTAQLIASISNLTATLINLSEEDENDVCG